MKVLIIDGASLFHIILQDTFSDTGIELVLCETVAEGVVQLERDNIDFICVAKHLSDGEGIAFTKLVRQKKGYSHLPVILFTSDETSLVYNDALAAGVTEVFHKKDVQQLVNFISRFTLQQQPFSARVLYVEDTYSQQKVVTKMFESYGLQVDAYASGEEAWEAYLQKDYDLLVTDILLDGTMTGMSLINRIRRLNDQKGDIPILAVTAFDDASRRIDLFYLGVSDYVIKPIIEEELIARIRNLVLKNQYYLELVVQRKLAQESDRMKSTFLANMSHELRTPMHGIMSFSKFGVDNAETATREKIAGYFANIQKSGGRLLRLLNDLLDLSKLEAGKMVLDLRQGDLVSLFSACLIEQEQRLNDLSLQIKWQKPDTPILGVFDNTKIMQVMTNLLSNAIKFNRKNGAITIRILKNDNNELMFSLQDEGAGIVESELDDVFNAFVQSSKVRSSSGGTGLGLAISREIITGHDGRIWAENRDIGAIFTFVIPVRKIEKDEK